MKPDFSLQTLAAKADLDEAEVRATVDVLESYGAYFRDYARLTANGVSLSGFVLSALLDRGKIAGHEFSGGTLEKYNTALASALKKIEATLPNRTNPLAPLAVN